MATWDCQPQRFRSSPESNVADLLVLIFLASLITLLTFLAVRSPFQQTIWNIPARHYPYLSSWAFRFSQRELPVAIIGCSSIQAHRFPISKRTPSLTFHLLALLPISTLVLASSRPTHTRFKLDWATVPSHSAAAHYRACSVQRSLWRVLHSFF